MTKLLTISIPTWNRVIFLKELVSELIIQITKFNLNEEIDLLISDNNSEDSTWSFIQSISETNTFIKSNKNSENLGAKTNVILSMYLAQSKYVMFLGDDDRIRDNCLIEIITLLKSENNIGVLVDISKFKLKSKLIQGNISSTMFFENLFWYMGNAGFFICKTQYIKSNLDKFGIDFFNECWPQTQLMLLGISFENPLLYISDIKLPINSKHDEVMVYSSFYLWRTCVFDLLNSLTDIEKYIKKEFYISCRKNIRNGIRQNFFNIMQCGIYIDDTQLRKKTRKHIYVNLNRFSMLEKCYLFLIIFSFSLPVSITRALSNTFIWITRGNQGLLKKNQFVQHEIAKRQRTNNVIRSLAFEKN